MNDATHEGMVIFEVRRIDTGKVVAAYECCDPECARLLAAGEYGGDPEDYEASN